MKRFPSIKNNSDFRVIYSKGRSRASENIVMYVLNNPEGGGRIGITAGRKFGNSVVRHRFIRRMREIYRANVNNTGPGTDIVIVARRPAAGAGYHSLESDYIGLLKRLKVYKFPDL